MQYKPEDLGFPVDDLSLTAQELEAKYGDAGHPKFPLQEWNALQKSGGDAEFNGYWDWVSESMDQIDLDTSNEPDEMVVVETLDDFARMVALWQQNKLAVIKHMLEIPAGTEVEAQLDETGPKKLVLEGELLEGFKLGLHLAGMEFSQLPFQVMSGPRDNDAPAAQGE